MWAILFLLWQGWHESLYPNIRFTLRSDAIAASKQVAVLAAACAEGLKDMEDSN